MLLNLSYPDLFPLDSRPSSTPSTPNPYKYPLQTQTMIASTSSSLFSHYFTLQNKFQNLNPLNRPLYIQIEQGQPSPYLKQLLSKVGSSEIQFLDFTLQNNDDSWSDEQDQDLDEDNKMSVIDQQQQSQHQFIDCQQEGENSHQEFKYHPEEYIPNMHLLDLPPSFLNIAYFNSKMHEYKNKPTEEIKEFLYLYLTDEDLQTYKDATIDHLIRVIQFNLLPFGIISKLQRKTKVTRYLQKKKRRIWKKKINYDCRKKVADNRLRVKGKFVTRQQACIMLGIDLCSEQQLKEKLKNNYKSLMY